MSGVEVYEVPVDALTAGFMRAFEVQVPTERGEWVEVNVMHNLVRNTYEVEWSAELLEQAPEALTATVGLVMLAIRERHVPSGDLGRSS